MGLDMYLDGRRFFMKDKKDEDGYDIKTMNVELGYWRKHPNLHGYIVDQFADGEDDCRPIELFAPHIEQITKAIMENELPNTEGFFFGVSDTSAEQVTTDLDVFNRALEWLKKGEGNKDEIRSIIYQASW